MTTATAETATTKQTEDTTGNKPVTVFRHRSISASVFANKGKNGATWHSVSLQRAYKVDDEYRHSSSFTGDEIPVAVHLLQEAWKFILDAEAKRNE